MTILNDNHWFVFVFRIVYIYVYMNILFVLCDIPGARIGFGVRISATK